MYVDPLLLFSSGHFVHLIFYTLFTASGHFVHLWLRRYVACGEWTFCPLTNTITKT